MRGTMAMLLLLAGCNALQSNAVQDCKIPMTPNLQDWIEKCEADQAALTSPHVVFAKDAGSSSDKRDSWWPEFVSKFDFAGQFAQWKSTVLPDGKTFTSLLASEKEFLGRKKSDAMGGKLVGFPIYRKAYVAFFDKTCSEVDKDAATKAFFDYASDHEIQAAYYATATNNPQLRELQADILSAAAKHFATHPRWAEASAKFMALGNTSAALPYSAAPPSTSVLQKVMSAF